MKLYRNINNVITTKIYLHYTMLIFKQMHKENRMW